MIPLGDENPSRSPPFMTWMLILGNVLVFLLMLTESYQEYEVMIMTFGLTPYAVLRQGTYLTFITSMFLHADIFHIGGNMLFLYVFGDNVEDSCGHPGFLVYYLISGIGASLLHIALDPYSRIPTIGASGAISGLLSAYVTLFPHARIRTIVSFGWFIRLVRVPAYVMIGTWFLYQLIYAVLVADPTVAFWAHIGGFLTGLLLIKLFARRSAEQRSPYYVTYRG